MSACSWSPLALRPCQFLKIITHLPPQAGRNLNGRDKEELLAGNQGGCCLSQSPGFPAFYTQKISNPEMASFQLLHWVPPCKCKHKNHGSSFPEIGEGRGSWWNPEESGPSQQKAAENFGGFRNVRTRCHCLSDSSLGVNQQ